MFRWVLFIKLFSHKMGLFIYLFFVLFRVILCEWSISCIQPYIQAIPQKPYIKAQLFSEYRARSKSNIQALGKGAPQNLGLGLHFGSRNWKSFYGLRSTKFGERLTSVYTHLESHHVSVHTDNSVQSMNHRRHQDPEFFSSTKFRSLSERPRPVKKLSNGVRTGSTRESREKESRRRWSI